MNLQLPASGTGLTIPKPTSYAGAVYEGMLVGVAGPGVVKPVSARWPDVHGNFSFVLPASVRGKTVHFWESFQQLFQYQQNWITYRSTCESLKHEKYLYLSAAGSYANALRPQALLSERVEGLVSQSMRSGRRPRRNCGSRIGSERSRQRELGRGLHQLPAPRRTGLRRSPV
jgi:hypothetical protein